MPAIPIDASAIEVQILHTLQGLADSYDFETLTVLSDRLFVTHPGVRTYALPDDFQRFLLPKDEQDHGLFLHNGTHEAPLIYREPPLWRRGWSTTNGRPQYYTLTAGPLVHLDPPPDANGTTGYRGTGCYIRTLTADALDGPVPLLFPAGLIDIVLAQVATDYPGPASGVLREDGEKARTRLINAHGRMRQQFHPRAGRDPQPARQ
jgi:hypothetical protein